MLSVKYFHKMKSRVSKEEVCLSLLKGSTGTYCFGKKKESLCETWPFKYLPAEMLSDFTVLLVNCKENYRTNARVLTTLQVNILYLMVLPGVCPLISLCLLIVGGWLNFSKLHIGISMWLRAPSHLPYAMLEIWDLMSCLSTRGCWLFKESATSWRNEAGSGNDRLPLRFPLVVQWEHQELREEEARTVSKLVEGELLSSCNGKGSSELMGWVGLWSCWDLNLGWWRAWDELEVIVC